MKLESHPAVDIQLIMLGLPWSSCRARTLYSGYTQPKWFLVS